MYQSEIRTRPSWRLQNKYGRTGLLLLTVITTPALEIDKLPLWRNNVDEQTYHWIHNMVQRF